MVINVYNEATKRKAIVEVAFLDSSEFHQVKITKKRAKRSINQNSLYWMWLTCIEQETGNDKDDLHLFFKNKFIGQKYVYLGDHESLVTISTTKLNTAKFKQYLDKVQMFANAELNISLPNPEDLQFEQFKDYYSKFL
jgi:hypothetical protein